MKCQNPALTESILSYAHNKEQSKILQMIPGNKIAGEKHEKGADFSAPHSVGVI
jgi:hypothetical protein